MRLGDIWVGARRHVAALHSAVVAVLRSVVTLVQQVSIAVRLPRDWEPITVALRKQLECRYDRGLPCSTRPVDVGSGRVCAQGACRISPKL